MQHSTLFEASVAGQMVCPFEKPYTIAFCCTASCQKRTSVAAKYRPVLGASTVSLLVILELSETTIVGRQGCELARASDKSDVHRPRRTDSLSYKGGSETDTIAGGGRATKLVQ
eukprot:6197818-Pleurochrysis_carterae.AAC.2